jgi:hypothetical protein
MSASSPLLTVSPLYYTPGHLYGHCPMFLGLGLPHHWHIFQGHRHPIYSWRTHLHTRHRFAAPNQNTRHPCIHHSFPLRREGTYLRPIPPSSTEIARQRYQEGFSSYFSTQAFQKKRSITLLLNSHCLIAQRKRRRKKEDPHPRKIKEDAST